MDIYTVNFSIVAGGRRQHVDWELRTPIDLDLELTFYDKDEATRAARALDSSPTITKVRVTKPAEPEEVPFR